MALSIDSIFKPINDFFINKFQTDDNSNIVFRFQRCPSPISDDSFVADDNTVNKAIAKETFSDLVNLIPFEESNEVNINFGSNSIDNEYFKILNSSIPFVNSDDPNKDLIINSFQKIKAEANHDWENYSLVRNDGIADKYRLSIAAPSNWYEKSITDIWEKKIFTVSDNADKPPDNSNKFQLWKFKLNDEQLKKNLPSLVATKKIQPIALRKDVVMMKSPTIRAVSPSVVVRDHRSAGRTVRVVDHRNHGATVRIVDHRKQSATSPFVKNLKFGLKGLALNNRLAVLHYIRENAPTKPSSTNNISIQFEYCIVSVQRPWMMDILLNDKTWFMPGISKGKEIGENSEIDFTLLPIRFLAVRNLVIEANWSNDDIEACKKNGATNFGPFEVEAEIINNKLTHEGTQIIGWILQKLPDIPPMDPPSS